MNLFQTGDFTLASGQKSSWKIECDALTEADWYGLATMLAEILPMPFGMALGVPNGGLLLADTLNDEYRTTGLERLLVVDDVWTTGGSMERFVSAQRTDWPIFRAVVFARSPVPPGVVALFTIGNKR